MAATLTVTREDRKIVCQQIVCAQREREEVVIVIDRAGIGQRQDAGLRFGRIDVAIIVEVETTSRRCQIRCQRR